MKTKKSIKVLLAGLALFAVMVFLWIGFRQIRAEQIIHSYMVSKGMDIEPGTKEYQRFMRDILWGAYPELFGISDFIKNEEEVVYVHDYAYRYSGYEEVYGKDLFSIFLDNLNSNNLKEATAPTQMPNPTATFTPVSPTITLFTLAPPTVMPTLPPPPIFTPDAIQVERWKEYQAKLAKVLLSFDPEHPMGYEPEAYKDALCEWDILGQSGWEVYLWARCVSADEHSSGSYPAVIYLDLEDGSILEVIVARDWTDHSTQLPAYDLHLFPISIQEKLCLYYFWGTVPQCGSIIPNYLPGDGLSSRELEMYLHLKYRIAHPEEPPLIVLSVMPTTTPTP